MAVGVVEGGAFVSSAATALYEIGNIGACVVAVSGRKKMNFGVLVSKAVF